MIIATDLDGTLLDDSKLVGEQEQKWLLDFLSKGNVLAFLTSRNMKDVKTCVPWMLELEGCKRYIGFDEGARLLLPDNRIVEMPKMNISQVIEAIEQIQDQIIGFTVFYDGGHYDIVFSWRKLVVLKLKGFIKREHSGRYLSWKVFKKKKDLLFWKIKPVVSSQKRKPIYEMFRHDLNGYCVTLNEGRIEIMHSESGKLGALKYICRKEKISIHDVFYFGDEGNDLYCMEQTTSYAMGNAPDWIKSVARNTTDDNNHHGVYKILNKLTI